MSEFQRGYVERLKLNSDVFEVVEILPSGMLWISNPRLRLITNSNGVEPVDAELDELPNEPLNY